VRPTSLISKAIELMRMSGFRMLLSAANACVLLGKPLFLACETQTADNEVHTRAVVGAMNSNGTQRLPTWNPRLMNPPLALHLM